MVHSIPRGAVKTAIRKDSSLVLFPREPPAEDLGPFPSINPHVCSVTQTVCRQCDNEIVTDNVTMKKTGPQAVPGVCSSVARGTEEKTQF